MIPVYYFDKMPEVLPDDDACYIVSKHIYLKKRSGLIDAMVKVNTIDMGEELPEYAKMNLPKIKAKTFGQVAGFFKMVERKYHAEAGVILNLKTHPQNEKLKKIDYTVPHQLVSHGGCKYEIAISPHYINCGTIHSHCDFGAFHSGTDQNDERYFDGLHITVGHVHQDMISISACVVINGKRIKVKPEDYVEGIQFTRKINDTEYYEFIDKALVVENEKYLDYVKPRYPRWEPYRGVSFGEAKKYELPIPRIPSIWNRSSYEKDEEDEEDDFSPCDKCIYKGIEHDDTAFDDDDITFTSSDRDNFEYLDNRTTYADFEKERQKVLKKSIKCYECNTTFFVSDPTIDNKCPTCETIHEGKSFTFSDFLKKRREAMENRVV